MFHKVHNIVAVNNFRTREIRLTNKTHKKYYGQNELQYDSVQLHKMDSGTSRL